MSPWLGWTVGMKKPLFWWQWPQPCSSAAALQIFLLWELGIQLLLTCQPQSKATQGSFGSTYLPRSLLPPLQSPGEELLSQSHWGPLVGIDPYVAEQKEFMHSALAEPNTGH